MAKKRETASRNLEKVIALSNEMLELADLGDNYRLDDGCGVVFGTLRDSAYNIRRLAKSELVRHERTKRPSLKKIDMSSDAAVDRTDRSNRISSD
ncbi:MAG: hypothetical protein GY866_43610 [Proteobacteria bacterium]|nr:hypothetical protein [Pseudomonadota bacterium]